MSSSERLYSRFALIAGGEHLADRFLYTGCLPSEPPVNEAVLIYSLEVTRPWFPSSRLIPTITNTLSARYSIIKNSANKLKSFEAALKDVNGELLAIAEQGETDWLGHLNALLVLVVGSEVHIAQTGTSTAYLFRQRKITQITDEGAERGEPHPLTTFSNIISGQVAEGDRIVFSNQDLFSLVSLDQIRTAVTDQTPWMAALTLARSLKRSKVAAVSSIIWAIEKRSAWSEVGEEPVLINLEESMQSWTKQAWKRVKPLVKKAGEISRKTWQVAVQGAQRQAPRVRALAGQAAARVQSVPTRQPPTWLLAAETSLAGRLSSVVKPVAEAAKPLFVVENFLSKGVGTVRPWLTGRRLRFFLVLAAMLLIIGTAQSIRQRSANQSITESRNNNETVLADVFSLAERLDAAITLKQGVEAAKLWEEATARLAQVASPTVEQASEATDLRSRLQQRGDILTGTTRLAAQSQLAALPNSRHIINSEKGVVVFSDGKEARFFIRQLANNQQDFSLQSPIFDAVYNRAHDEILALSEGVIYGIRRSAAGDSVEVATKDNSDGSFATGHHLAVFANNLYVLDTEGNALWKYIPSGDVFGRGLNQIDPTTLTVTGARDLAIDGYIYVLQRDGQIVKLLRGQPETDFALANLPPGTDQSRFYRLVTSDEVDTLYVLAQADDSTGAEAGILVINKDGAYAKKYAFNEAVGTVTDFDVDLLNKLAYVLAGETVYVYAL